MDERGPDAGQRPVGPHAFDQPTEGRLRGAVTGRAGQPAVAGETRYRHHVTGPVLPHRRDDRLDGIEGTEEIHAELGFQSIRVGFQSVRPEPDARIGHEQVDGTQPLRERPHRRVRLAPAGGVGRDALGARPGDADGGGEALQPIQAAGGKSEVVAVTSQLEGQRPPDAARGPRDDCDPSHDPPGVRPTATQL